MNSKALVRITEAAVASLMVVSVLAIIAVQTHNERESDLESVVDSVLERIATDEVLREEILTLPIEEAELKIEEFLSVEIANPTLEFDARVCFLELDCVLIPARDGEIYSAERLIGATNSAVGPKRIKIFVWRQEGL